MRKIYILAILLVLLLSACRKGRPQGAKPPKNDRAYNVLVKEVKLESITEYVETTGKLEGITDIQMRSEVSGKIISLKKDLGDWVNKGEEIGKIDNVDYEIALRQAKAAYLAAKANFKSAKIRFKNSKELYSKDQISEIEFVQSESAFEQAKAGRESSAANLERAEKNLKNSKFTAPVSGRISYMPLKEGETISIGGVICSIVNANKLIVNTGVGENEISKLKQENEVIIEHDNLSKPIIGKITGIGIKPMMNSINYPVKVLLPNTEKKLLPGMIVNVKIVSEIYNKKIIIPQNKVMKKYDDRFVYTIKANTAHKTLIETGKQIDGSIIVEKGLFKGDKVVLDGADNLNEGSKVIVKKILD